MPYRINPQTGSTEYVNAQTGATLIPQAASGVSNKPGLLKSLSNMLIPRTSQLAQKAKAGINLSLFNAQEEQDRKKRQDEINKIIVQAKQEADPQQRSRLLKQAQTMAAEGTEKVRTAISNFEQESGTKINDKDRIMAEALGVAGELGTFFIPAGKLAQGAKLTQRIIQGAKLGLKAGALTGATNPDAESLQDRVSSTVRGAAAGYFTGAGTSAVFEIPRKAVLGALNSTGGKQAVARFFDMSPSKRAEFRKSTGNLDFETEIIAREGKSMAGKSYEEIGSLFTERLNQARNKLDDILGGSSKTVSKKEMISELQKLSNKLKPSRGRVGTSDAYNSVLKAIDDISSYPSENMPLITVNNIKRDLQALGDAAYSPSGKATTASKAMANAASLFQKKLESIEDGIGNANQDIQLYKTAKDAIEKVGDSAAKNKSNDVFQKVLQQIPTIAAVTAGVGGYAAGGPSLGAGAAFAALLITGSGAAARKKYLSSEFQSFLTSKVGNALKSSGLKKADSVMSSIWLNAMSRVASQQAAQSATETPETLIEGQSVAPVGTEQEIPTQDMAQVQSGQEYVNIVNKKTGEKKQILKSELTQYGLPTDADESLPGIPSKNELYAAMVLDAQATGGKNISKLTALLSAYDKVYGKDELSAAQKSRLVKLQQAETTVSLVENVALQAGTGITATAKAKFAKLPGVEGGAEEDLGRLTDGLAKAIASTLAGESGVATDKDIERWKGLMPKVSDTMAERERAITRLKDALDAERARLSIPDSQQSASEPLSIEGLY